MESTVREQQGERSGQVRQRARTPRPPYRDGVAAGLVIVIGGTLAVMAAYGELYVDALAFLVVFAGLAIWAARTRSRALRWTIAGLLSLFVAINLIYAVPDLSHPESPAPFIATSVVVVGGIVTVALAVLAARNRPAAGAKVWAVTLGVLGVAALGSLLAGSRVQDDPVRPGDTTVVADGYSYPDEVVMDSSSDAIIVRNADRGRHTFAVEGQDSAVEIPAGSQVSVAVDLEPGTYRYYCTVPGHESMQGSLLVE